MYVCADVCLMLRMKNFLIMFHFIDSLTQDISHVWLYKYRSEL